MGKRPAGRAIPCRSRASSGWLDRGDIRSAQASHGRGQLGHCTETHFAEGTRARDSIGTGTAVVTVFAAPVQTPAAGSGSNLAGSNLTAVDLSNGFLVGAGLQGSNLSQTLLQGAFLDGVDLSGSNLTDADLAGPFLVAANLSAANLSDADLADAFLNRADLTGTNLTGTNLTGADLADVDLTGANLHGATLTGVVWSNTTCPDGTNSDADGGACPAEDA